MFLWEIGSCYIWSQQACLRFTLKQASALQRNYLESASLLAVFWSKSLFQKTAVTSSEARGLFLITKMSRCARHDNPFWSQPACLRLAETSFSTPEKLFGVSQLACVVDYHPCPILCFGFLSGFYRRGRIRRLMGIRRFYGRSWTRRFAWFSYD